ncbi:LysR substrate-binding domain-containing protein [Staphylococcus pasteuri]|uniref:LysR family transcriptional regulator n=1 Tax=Staphylococcus TaxID=1279 RepID=UPI0008A5B7F1|nr:MULTISPECIES: LysR family transcriptional regulator [Staphylococcus]OFV08555.1 LysR family transcriptional regulator [Staphylococcus sp. HMSC13A10]
MDINHLKEFILLAKYENYLKASQELFIAQSTLSKHMTALENDIGHRLIDRTNKKIELTESGSLFLHYAKQICQNEEELKKHLSLKDVDDIVTINMGASRLMIEYGITELVSQCVKLYPKVRFKITEGSEIELKQAIDQQKLDISFIRELSPAKSNNSFVYMKEQLCAIAKNTHPLANQDEISLEMLKDEQLYLPPDFTVEHQAFLKCCEKEQFYPIISFTAPRMENLLEMVNINEGIALIMEHQARFYLNESYKLIPLKPEIDSYINCKLHHDCPDSKELENFMSIARQNSKN